MSTEDTPSPECPFTVTVTKPGHPTVHLGYGYQFAAEMAAANLTMQLTGTAHPEGTTITWGKTPADVEPEPMIPAYAGAIAELISGEDAGSAYGVNFPDTYSRLIAQEGHERGGELWQSALSLLDEPAPEPEEADVPSVAEQIGRLVQSAIERNPAVAALFAPTVKRPVLDPDVLEQVLIEHIGESRTREIFAAYDAAAGGVQ